jgi:death-on-curing protein
VNEPVWLSAELVASQNRALVEDNGEPFAMRDWGLLESAVARPRSHWAYSGEEDVFHLACVLCFGIAANHPFEQGNKRTGWAADHRD